MAYKKDILHQKIIIWLNSIEKNPNVWLAFKLNIKRCVHKIHCYVQIEPISLAGKCFVFYKLFFEDLQTDLGVAQAIILLVGAILLVNAMYYMVSEQCLLCIVCNILTFTILHIFVVEELAPFVNKQFINITQNLIYIYLAFFMKKHNIEECVYRTRISPNSNKIKQEHVS